MTRPRPTRMKLAVRMTIMAVLLLVVFGGLYAYQNFRAQATAQFLANMKPAPLPVATAIATSGEVPRYLQGIGSLKAVHEVTISPEVGGRVTKIMFKAGAKVQVGDPLVQIDDAPERGDLANYEAQAHLAETNLRRATKLAAREFETKANVDTYKAQLAQAKAQIQRTKATIAQKLIRAPFSGTLGIRDVDLGQYVSAGAKLVTLTDLNTLFVDFTLPEDARSKVMVGQTVVVTLGAFPSRQFTAKLTTIEPQVNTATRTLTLQATLDNPAHLLLPGMFVHARVILAARQNVVTVPATAVDNSLYGDSVYLIVKDTDGKKPGYHVKRIFVTTGELFGDKVAILSGLKAGDKVVATGQNRLQDGVPITLTTDTLKPPSQPPLD